MTLKNLHAEVCALGFDDRIDCDGRLVTAANCALRMIFAEREVRRTVSVIATDRSPLFHREYIVHSGGDVLTFPLSGRAFSLKVSGRGELVIRDGAELRTVSFDTEGERIRGLLKTGGELTLRGDYRYTVTDLSVFGDVFGPGDEDIPDGSGKKSYAISEMFPDFQSFAEEARDRAGRPIPEATLTEGRLILDEKYEGEVLVTYRRAPEKVLIDAPDRALDIPAELSALLPLATAAFICLDGDGEKSSYYMSLYDKMLEGIKRSATSVSSGKYVTNGWA